MIYKQPLCSIQAYGDVSPRFGEGTFIADGARVIGDVESGADVSYWFNVTVRGDCNWIKIGPRTNIQDNTVIHVTYKTGPVTIGEEVTIGHSAVIHACTIGDRCLIGMGAVILDGAVIPDNCVVAAGSTIPPGKTYEPGSLILGAPAKAVRSLKPEEIADLEASYKRYIKYKSQYISDLQSK